MDIDDHPQSHHDAEASSSGGSDGEPEAPTELMVVSRARRSNAGNRMATLIAKSALEEEEWGEEWEEAANEEEFVGNDVNEQDDFNLESSESEEEDGGDDEDDAGEKELRKVEQQQRVKKRKTGTNPFFTQNTAAQYQYPAQTGPATNFGSSNPFGPRPSQPQQGPQGGSLIDF